MNNTCRNAPSPVLKNTCRGPRASMLQCAGCLPPHTDRIQQDIRPTDRPSAAGAEDGARRKGARRRDGRRRGGPRAQPAAAGARGNYVNPNAGRDWPRPRDAHAAARSAAAPLPPIRSFGYSPTCPAKFPAEREIGVYWYLFSNHCPRRCVYETVIKKKKLSSSLVSSSSITAPSS